MITQDNLNVQMILELLIKEENERIFQKEAHMDI
jgi:hypothetical protein